MPDEKYQLNGSATSWRVIPAYTMMVITVPTSMFTPVPSLLVEKVWFASS
jgi:hypothetical protein